MTPAVRSTVLACLYFAGFGCLIPFLPLWLEKVHGFTGAEIGVVLAIAGFSRALAGPLTAAWADGRSDRRAPLFLFTGVLTAGFLILRFLSGFVAVFALILILDIAFWGLLPVVETTLLRLTRSGRPSYGLGRGLASAAFVGGTTLLTTAHSASERVRVQSTHDFIVFGSVAMTALTSGAVQAMFGWNVLNLTVVPPVLIAFVDVGCQ